jgi:flagellar basal body-associated protein FliL
MNGGNKMSKALRWILYILLGLVVLAVVAGIVFTVFGGFGYAMMRPGIRMMEPMRFYYHPARSIFGGLLCLGVILLVIVGIVSLVYALTHKNQPTQTIPPVQTATPLDQVTTPPAEEATPTHTCSNCGKPAQEDWKTCPYCGNPLT